MKTKQIFGNGLRNFILPRDSFKLSLDEADDNGRDVCDAERTAPWAVSLDIGVVKWVGGVKPVNRTEFLPFISLFDRFPVTRTFNGRGGMGGGDAERISLDALTPLF